MSKQIGAYDGSSWRRWQNFLLKSRWLHYALGLIFFYASWVLIFYFLSLTFATYLLGSSRSSLQEINDVIFSNQVSLNGFSAYLFVILLWRLHPVTHTSWAEIFDKGRFENIFIPAFFRGFGIAGLLVLITILQGTYQYLGVSIQFNTSPLETLNLVFRMIALAVWTYSEEFLFRYKLVNYLKNQIPPWIGAQWITLAYCGIKLLQFDLSGMQFMTLYLLSLNLTYRSYRTGFFEQGAGYWAASLIAIQPLASLPLFGSDFSGILIVKPSEQWSFLTGGLEGPTAGFIIQLLLLIDLLRSMLRKRRPNEG